MAAEVDVAAGETVTAVALYGLLDELSDSSVHRSLSEISPYWMTVAIADLCSSEGTSTPGRSGQQGTTSGPATGTSSPALKHWASWTAWLRCDLPDDLKAASARMVTTAPTPARGSIRAVLTSHIRPITCGHHVYSRSGCARVLRLRPTSGSQSQITRPSSLSSMSEHAQCPVQLGRGQVLVAT